jgi:hypothetical protein
MERSVQFNLLSLETMHHGKCTLGSNASTQAQVASSKGGLAQLVERLLCKQNVNGSNPLTSTTRDCRFVDFRFSIEKSSIYNPQSAIDNPLGL